MPEPFCFFMSVAQPQFNLKPSTGGQSFVKNGFNSVPSSARGSQLSASNSEVLEHKCREAEKVSRVLRFASGASVVQGLADRIFQCAQRENDFTADDLHNAETGELYAGRGSLWSCNSRICPKCVAKLSRRNRRIARHVFDSEKVFLGEHWFFLTFTMPDLVLKEFPLLFCRAVINDAWRKFSRSAWFAKVIRGGMKSEEFTVGRQDQYHYHIHSLGICRNRITSDNFIEIRREWTKALKFSFKKHGVKFQCNTRDGYANVNVQKVYNKRAAVMELCKYLTKSESWSLVPPEQLADIATVERFPRMFEVFGACKATAKAMHPIRPEKTLTEGENAAHRHVTDDESASNDAYIYTKNITVRNSVSPLNYLPAPRKKRLSWRIRCRILPRAEWLKSLDEEISRCQEYRMKQLRHKFAFATFQTLDGRTF
jgi:hypothetical protein